MENHPSSPSPGEASEKPSSSTLTGEQREKLLGQIKESSYLGDGVYVAFDGFAVVMTTGHHDPAQAENVVYMEPSVLDAFIGYCQRITEMQREFKKL